MVLRKALCWALIFIIKIRFPPATSLVTVLNNTCSFPSRIYLHEAFYSTPSCPSLSHSVPSCLRVEKNTTHAITEHYTTRGATESVAVHFTAQRSRSQIPGRNIARLAMVNNMPSLSSILQLLTLVISACSLETGQ